LWDRYYVGLKAMSGKLWFHKVKGMFPDKSDAEIAKIAANDINNNYGGLNWEVLGVSKTHLDAARLVLLAPDWTISNWRFFIDAAKISDELAILKGGIYKGGIYEKQVAGEPPTTAEGLFFGAEETAPATRYMGRVISTLGLLVAAVNIALWGTPLPHEPEDREGKWYMIKLPYKTEEGEYYYLDIIGHFFEPVRAAGDPIRWAKGKRSVGWKIVEEAVTGRDWKGSYIKSTSELYEGMKEGDYNLYKSRFDTESTGWGAIPTRVIHGLTSFVPIPVQTAVDVGTGNKDAIEFSGSVGLPTRRGARLNASQKMTKLMPAHVQAELTATGTKITNIGKTIEKTELTVKQYLAYQMLAAEEIKKTLSERILTAPYSTWPVEKRKERLKELISQAIARARDDIARKIRNGDL